MTHGIQISTSDGVKTELNFKAGRLLGVSSELGVLNDRNHSPPAGVSLASVAVWINTSFLWRSAFKYQVNAGSNIIEIRKHPNVSVAAPGFNFQFYYIAFQ